jgi:hypothetical protein
MILSDHLLVIIALVERNNDQQESAEGKGYLATQAAKH